ncbi:MAG: LptA/OstA family protein, partial [Marinomonas sp.]
MRALGAPVLAASLAAVAAAPAAANTEAELVEAKADALVQNAEQAMEQTDAQVATDTTFAQPSEKAAPAPREVDFAADSATYDNIRDIITASGNVTLNDGTQTVRADALEWNRKEQIITASGNILVKRDDRSVRGDNALWNLATKTIQVGGNVRLVDEAGNQLYTQSVELDDAFETGAIEEVLVALRAGGRLAARSGERGENGAVVLNDAAYTACKVQDPDGCGKDPSWRVTADQVTYDPETNVVDFDGAMLELFGRRILPLPGLAVRTDGRAISGFLVPDLRISESNGVEVRGNY